MSMRTLNLIFPFQILRTYFCINAGALKDFSILADSGTCENFGFLLNKTSGITVCQCLVRCCKSLLGRFIWDLFLSVLQSRLELVLKYVSVFSKYCRSVMKMPFVWFTAVWWVVVTRNIIWKCRQRQKVGIKYQIQPSPKKGWRH